MDQYYKPYISDDSESESESDGYTSEESLVNLPGKQAPISSKGPVSADFTDANPQSTVGTSFEQQEYKNTNLITINSRDRDTTIYPQPTFFSLRLPRVFKNVKTINLSQLNLLNSFFNFSASAGNTTLYVQEQGRVPIPITIRDGTYTSDDLVTELNSALNATPLFADITLGAFIAGFQTTGDFTLLFNTPGNVVYNSLTQSYDTLKSINDIVARYFVQQQSVGTVTYTYNQCLVAYYYPVLKEMVLNGSTNGLIYTPTFTSYNDFYTYVVFYFEGISDQSITTIVSNTANQALMDTFRYKNTFNVVLVNNYTCTYNTKQGRLIISAPSLDISISNDLTSNYNNYLNQAILSNGNFVDSNDFFTQYNNISNENAALIGFYNFIHNQFTSGFGISFGTYAAEFFANPSSLIELYNTSNKYGWYPTLTPQVSANSLMSNPLPAQQPILWSNISFASNTSNQGFISTCFSTTNITFPNSGEDVYGYFDIQCPLYPTSYQRISFISPIRQDISIMTIPRTLDNRTSTNDMVFNLGPTTTPYLFDINSSTTFIRTDISGNILFNLYTCKQNMFASPEYMIFENKWITYLLPQILAGQKIQTNNPNYNVYPPINDININSYRPFVFFEVIADQYLTDPNAHFNITFYVEKQDGTAFNIPMILVAYKDRAAFMADAQNDLNGQIGVENPYNYFQRQVYDASTTSAQLTIDVNNNQHIFFHVHIENGVTIPSEIPLRVYALLSDPYGTYRERTRIDGFDLPFTQSTLSHQTNPNTLIDGTLPSIYNSTVTQIGYDSNGVSNNLLDYIIQSGSNYYDPVNISDYIINGGVSTGLRYQFTLLNNGAPQPPPVLSTWSLFFGSGSSTIIHDTYNTNSADNNTYLAYGTIQPGLPPGGSNEFIMTNWWSSSNPNNPEQYWTPNSNNNYVEYIGLSSIFLTAQNNPPLITDSVTSSFSATSYTDISGFSAFGFFLPPNQVVHLTDLVIKFVYTQPSFDANYSTFTRAYSPMPYTGIVNNQLFYRNQTTLLNGIDSYVDWDDWYSMNRRNMKIGIFNTSNVQNQPISNIQLSNAITTLSLIQITQVNNYRDVFGTLKTREPDWGTYYRYTFTPSTTQQWAPNFDVWSTGVVSSFYSIISPADFAPSNYTAGPSTFQNYFQTNPLLYNYTYLPRSYGLTPAIANAISNPTTISSISADIAASYVAIPFYFDQATSTYNVGCFHGISFTLEPALPSTNLTGASPYYGPLGPLGWNNVNNVLSLMSTNTITTYYWNAKLVWNTLDNPYNPATDLTAFGNYQGISGEYQDTMLFMYKNSYPYQDYKDIVSSTNWVWGKENNSNYIAFDSNSGYNNLSYLQNIPVQANTEYVIHIRSYDPIPSFTTGIRMIGKGFTDFGIVSVGDLTREVSDLYGYHPISEAEASMYNYQLQNGIPNSYNTVVSTNNAIRFQNNHKYSIQYANALINFDKLFSTTITFGKTTTYPGITYTFRGYNDAISTYFGSFNGTRSLLSIYTTILSTAYYNLESYIQTRYGNILPSSVYLRSRYTDPLPFSLLFSTYTLPPYSYQYDEWGLGYNLGFNKVDTPIRTTVTSDTFIRIVQNYIYLRISPELNTNTMGVSGKEMLSDCRESGGEDAKFFSKILLNNFGSYSQTAISRPKDFNPVLGKYEVMTAQLTDKYGNQLSNIDCEYDFVLQIDEITNGPKDNSSLLGPTSDLNVFKIAR